jgi:hypothetical protein
MPEHGLNLGRGDEGIAERITIAIGERPKVYEKHYARVDYARSLVLIYDRAEADRTHIATAPLSLTLVEWA